VPQERFVEFPPFPHPFPFSFNPGHGGYVSGCRRLFPSPRTLGVEMRLRFRQRLSSPSLEASGELIFGKANIRLWLQTMSAFFPSSLSLSYSSGFSLAAVSARRFPPFPSLSPLFPLLPKLPAPYRTLDATMSQGTWDFIASPPLPFLLCPGSEVKRDGIFSSRDPFSFFSSLLVGKPAQNSPM